MAENLISVTVFASTQQITIVLKNSIFSVRSTLKLIIVHWHLSVCDSVIECLAGIGRLD